LSVLERERSGMNEFGKLISIGLFSKTPWKLGWELCCNSFEIIDNRGRALVAFAQKFHLPDSIKYNGEVETLAARAAMQYWLYN
jgi:hypothetical protein